MSDFTELVISPKTDTGKGRAFRALKVSAVMADALWDKGEGGKGSKHDHPICATLAASESELRAFLANLSCGRPAVPTGTGHHRHGSEGYEFLKSAGYKVCWQKHDAGSVATVYLPELLTRDPGMVDPTGAKFVVLAGAGYLAEQAKKMDVKEIIAYARRLPMVEELNEPQKDWRGHVIDKEEPLSKEKLEAMVPLSYLFALFLSNRSRAPIPPSGEFYLQLLIACMKSGLASRSTGKPSWSNDRNEFGKNHKYKFNEEDVEAAGFSPGIAFLATHLEIEAVLAAECEV